MKELVFQWTFHVKDVIEFNELTVSVYAIKYKEALRKIRDMKIPNVDEESLKLSEVVEINNDINDDDISEINVLDQ